MKKQDKLNDQQKQILQEGKPLHLEGMISKKVNHLMPHYSLMQTKEFVEFYLTRVTLTDRILVIISKILLLIYYTHGEVKNCLKINVRGKRRAEVVYMSMIDKKGEPYQGYITFDKEKNKINSHLTIRKN